MLGPIVIGMQGEGGGIKIDSVKTAQVFNCSLINNTADKVPKL